MRLTVLGGCGAWPGAGQACSGYLVEHDGFHLLVDPGYATLPRLLGLVPATEVDAVFVSHGHPDHCADLNPLLRARVLGDDESEPLRVLAPPRALDAVLSLDSVRGLDAALDLHETRDGDALQLGPFAVVVAELPHHVTNLGVRLDAGGTTLAYTGDSGPDPAVVTLAHGADVFLAEATFPDEVPPEDAAYLSDAGHAAEAGATAGALRALLTHWWPTATEAAYRRALGRAAVEGARLARPGETVPVGP